MSLFLLSFLLIYGGFHLYFFLRVKAALALPPWGLAAVAFFLLLMIAAPILVRLAERSGYERLAIFLAYFGYIWMGIVFVFAAAAIAVDCYRLLIWVGGLILHKELVIQAGPKIAFYLPLAFSIFVSIWGSFEAWNIQLEKVTLAHEKIPASLNGFKIVQISDVHLGLIVRHRRLRKILEVVKKAGPDLLVSTGDLVDGQINRLEGLAEMLQEIKPEYGKYAVTGNHEFYAGLDDALAFTDKAGFVILRNRGVSITGDLNIAGVDDRTWQYMGNGPDISEAAMLQALDRKKFTLLLKHRPEGGQGKSRALRPAAFRSYAQGADISFQYCYDALLPGPLGLHQPGRSLLPVCKQGQRHLGTAYPFYVAPGSDIDRACC